MRGFGTRDPPFDGKRAERLSCRRSRRPHLRRQHHASVVQWQGSSLPSWLRGFESHRKLQFHFRVAQLVERDPVKITVVGSSPTPGASLRASSGLPAGLQTPAEGVRHTPPVPDTAVWQNGHALACKASLIPVRLRAPRPSSCGGVGSRHAARVVSVYPVHDIG